MLQDPKEGDSFYFFTAEEFGKANKRANSLGLRGRIEDFLPANSKRTARHISGRWVKNAKTP